MPIVLFIIFALIFLTFDLHDEVCIRSSIYQEGHRIKGNEETQDLKNKIERFCITKIKDIKVEVGLLNIKISYISDKNIEIPTIKRLFEIKNKEKTLVIWKYDPMTAVRSIGGIR